MIRTFVLSGQISPVAEVIVLQKIDAILLMESAGSDWSCENLLQKQFWYANWKWFVLYIFLWGCAIWSIEAVSSDVCLQLLYFIIYSLSFPPIIFLGAYWTCFSFWQISPREFSRDLIGSPRIHMLFQQPVIAIYLVVTMITKTFFYRLVSLLCSLPYFPLLWKCLW